jgi:hypothetical protein
LGSSPVCGFWFRAIGDGVFLDVEADFGPRRLFRHGRTHELANGFEEGTDGVVMTFDAFFQFGELGNELDVAAEDLA